jgi:hypothetical protein
MVHDIDPGTINLNAGIIGIGCFHSSFNNMNTFHINIDTIDVTFLFLPWGK